MAWLTLVVAGLFETGFAVALKMSHGMTRLWPTAIFAACALLSFALLTMALRHLEVGPAYAVWTGIGAAGTAVIGMAFLGDTVSTLKLVSISLILAGVVGLNLSGVTPDGVGRVDGIPGDPALPEGDPARADSSLSGTARTRAKAWMPRGCGPYGVSCRPAKPGAGGGGSARTPARRVGSGGPPSRHDPAAPATAP